LAAFFFFSFLTPSTVGRTPWTGDYPVVRPLPTHRTTQTEQTHTIQTSMPWVGFEPTIPEFERARTVHGLDRPATVIGSLSIQLHKWLIKHSCAINKIIWLSGV
jgi:hypothetical protein